MTTEVHSNFTTQIIDTNDLGHYPQVITAQNYSNLVWHDAANNLTYWVEMDKANAGNWINWVHIFNHTTGIDTRIIVHTSIYSDVHLHASIGMTPAGNLLSACETGAAGMEYHPSPIEIKRLETGSFITKKTTVDEYAYQHFVRHVNYSGFIMRGSSNGDVSLLLDNINNGESFQTAPTLVYTSIINTYNCYPTVCGAVDKIRFCINDNNVYGKVFFLRSVTIDFDDDTTIFENIDGSFSKNVNQYGDGAINDTELEDYCLIKEAPAGCQVAINCIAVTPDTGRELFLLSQTGSTIKTTLMYYDVDHWDEKEISPFAVVGATAWKIYPYSVDVIDVYGTFGGIFTGTCKRYRTYNGGINWYFIENINDEYLISYIALSINATIDNPLVLVASYLNNGTSSADVLLAISEDTEETDVPVSKQNLNSTGEKFFNEIGV